MASHHKNRQVARNKNTGFAAPHRVPSPSSVLLGSYRPRNTAVHHAPLWFKAVLFFCLMTILALTGWRIALCLLAVNIALAYLGQIRTRELLLMLYAMRWLIILLGLYYTVWGEPGTGADVLLTLMTATLSSRILLMSTSLPVLIDGIIKICSPLKLVGINPARIGLAIALMIRSIPAIMDRWGDLQKAAVARGLLGRSSWRLFTPLVVQTVDYAQKTGDALAARGLGDS